jgi:hypothetical protein
MFETASSGGPNVKHFKADSGSNAVRIIITLRDGQPRNRGSISGTGQDIFSSPRSPE